MFVKIFYRLLKVLVCFYAIITGAVFIYAILNLQAVDAIIVGIIFVVGVFVGLFLVKYYGRANTVLSFKTEDEDIVLTNAKQLSVRMNKDKCISIYDKSNKVILEFDDGEKYYIIKHYPFGQRLSDFSNFNKENFKNAEFKL